MKKSILDNRAPLHELFKKHGIYRPKKFEAFRMTLTRFYIETIIHLDKLTKNQTSVTEQEGDAVTEEVDTLSTITFAHWARITRNDIIRNIKKPLAASRINIVIVREIIRELFAALCESVWRSYWSRKKDIDMARITLVEQIVESYQKLSEEEDGLLSLHTELAGHIPDASNSTEYLYDLQFQHVFNDFSARIQKREIWLTAAGRKYCLFESPILSALPDPADERIRQICQLPCSALIRNDINERLLQIYHETNPTSITTRVSACTEYWRPRVYIRKLPTIAVRLVKLYTYVEREMPAYFEPKFALWRDEMLLCYYLFKHRDNPRASRTNRIFTNFHSRTGPADIYCKLEQLNRLLQSVEQVILSITQLDNPGFQAERVWLLQNVRHLSRCIRKKIGRKLINPEECSRYLFPIDVNREERALTLHDDIVLRCNAIIGVDRRARTTDQENTLALDNRNPSCRFEWVLCDHSRRHLNEIPTVKLIGLIRPFLILKRLTMTPPISPIIARRIEEECDRLDVAAVRVRSSGTQTAVTRELTELAYSFAAEKRQSDMVVAFWSCSKLTDRISFFASHSEHHPTLVTLTGSRNVLSSPKCMLEPLRGRRYTHDIWLNQN